MHQMGLQALYPRRRTSQPGRSPPTCCGPCSSSVPTRSGRPIVAISRWPRGSSTWWPSWTGIRAGYPPGACPTPCDTDFCLEALQGALRRFGAPEIFNTDQAAQFTSEAFTGVLKNQGIQIRMDGKGRWVDNVFVERLWRSVTYEDLYLRAYETPAELRVGLNRYFEFYNSRRRHRALDRRPPDAVYFHQAAGKLAA